MPQCLFVHSFAVLLSLSRFRGKPQEKCPLCQTCYLPEHKGTVCRVCQVRPTVWNGDAMTVWSGDAVTCVDW